MSSFHGEFYA